MRGTVSEGRLRKGRNWICSDEAESHRARSAWNGRELLMVQPFLEGTGEGVFGLAAEHGVLDIECAPPPADDKSTWLRFERLYLEVPDD